MDKNGKVRFDIKMKVKASVEMLIKGATRDQYEKEIKRAIKKEIKTTYQYTQKRDIDLFRLSEKLYRKDIKAWKKVETNGRIPLKEDTLRSIQIDVQIQDTGKHRLTPIFEGQRDKGWENQ